MVRTNDVLEPEPSAPADEEYSQSLGTSPLVETIAQEIGEIRQLHEPAPWAGGRRDRYIRIPIAELTGYAVRG